MAYDWGPPISREGDNVQAVMIALAEEAAERLQGTCMSIADLGEKYEEAENSQSFCNRLDELVFCCDQCSWWDEISQMSDDSDGILMLCVECENEVD